MIYGILVLVFLFGLNLGYEVGHYEGIRCSCVPKTRHFIKRLLNRCA